MVTVTYFVVVVVVVLACSFENTESAIVEGVDCAVGGFMMELEPGEEYPVSCPPFVDQDGSCWVGDMGIDEFSCKIRFTEEVYNSWPRGTMK